MPIPNAPSTGSTHQPDSARPTQPPAPQQPETIKDTLISIMIAFTMAFVFRGFVVEAFVIPTGSMAPTLMGAHIQVQSEASGYKWPIGAVHGTREDPTNYLPVQQNIAVQDPITGKGFPGKDYKTYSGDRILVLKYLYLVNDPTRFDVIVFKNPTNPADNYIKRLIGLPGEQIALADGDVFVRTDPSGREPTSDDPAERAKLWDLPGWKIARKDPITQRAVWQLVFDSAFASPAARPGEWPWTPSEAAGWTMGAHEYQFAGQAHAELVFDQHRDRSAKDVRSQKMTWAIDDYYPYDEPMYDLYGRIGRFPVSDVRVRCGFEPAVAGETLRLLLSTRGQEFRASIGSGTAEIAVREAMGAAGIKGDWKVVATRPTGALEAGKVVNVEFWHSDQSVQVWIEGKEIVRYEYAWSPAERIRRATGEPLAEILRRQPTKDSRNELADQRLYKFGGCQDLRLVVDGGAFSFKRVALDRDLYYQPVSKEGGNGIAGLGTSPFAPLILGPDQFFACGDNSPASLDGRLWTKVDEWVDALYPPPPGPYPRAGVVPRDLLLGKAFFVYWPSVKWEGQPVPVPDFGRMRFIW